MMQDFSELIPIHATKDELEWLLRALKLRKKLSKSLGKRSKKALAQIQGERILRIEYAPAFDSANIPPLLERIFGVGYNDGYSVSMVAKADLKWWMRVFFDDDMVDISFLRAEHILLNS